MFGRDHKAVEELQAAVKALTERMAQIEDDPRNERLRVEQERSHLLGQQLAHAQERMRWFESEVRRLQGEVDRGTIALQNAYTIRTESQVKVQELEQVRKRVSELGREPRPMSKDDDESK